MRELGEQMKRRVSSDLIGRCSVSFLSFSLTQLALYMLPYFFPSLSLLILLSLSVVVMLALAGFGKCCKGLLRVRASAPAFVFFNITFIWAVFVGVIREVTSSLTDFVINMQFLMLVIGLFSVLSKDPGYVTSESFNLNKPVEMPSSYVMSYEFAAEEDSIKFQRVRYCRHCKAFVKGFDHHCPAFGNCIGQRNHVFFMILLIGFVFTEFSYASCSFQFTRKFEILDYKAGLASMLRNLAISTMLFSFLQVLWQVPFLAWHIYCVCFNIKTDEWINWRRYPEFHSIIPPEPGHTQNEMEIRFINPYNKGILWNVKDFLMMRE